MDKTNLPSTADYMVQGIMVKNRSNIYIADKSIKFCRDVHFGLFINKKSMALRDIQILTLDGAIKLKGGRGGRVSRTFYSVDKIAQNLICRRKIEK